MENERNKKLEWKAKRLRLTLNLRRKFNIRRKTHKRKVRSRCLQLLLDTAGIKESHKVRVEMAAKWKPNILLLAFYFLFF